MKKLFYKLLILFFPVIPLMIVIILLPLPSNSYHLAIIDKHRMLENTGSPRLVLASGSNLAFGIDSESIQSALGIPTINTAVQAGFGLGRILDDLAPFLNSGDILVIVPEYHHFESVWNGDEPAYTLIFDARQYRLLVNPSLYGFPSGISSYFASKISAMIPRPPNPLAYMRDGYNEYGDYVKHLAVENQKLASIEPLKTPERQRLTQFFRIVDDFTLRGITVLISYPSYEESAFRVSEPFILELDAAFQDRAVTVISNPQDYAFPRSYFYDTSYHLNAKGRELRTARFIQDLEQYYQGGSTNRAP
jgi:hypothetical protein